MKAIHYTRLDNALHETYHFGKKNVKKSCYDQDSSLGSIDLAIEITSTLWLIIGQNHKFSNLFIAIAILLISCTNF